ncbi:F-box/WD repeat-containing protein pof1 [Trichoplax sp. H2]|nr:F-box/WD repeat-containing protein pof1 [Trichoplax sp. H2]|eukprot:RDD41749.1 F-box/WD repeat-containing protein pof1 [Trichoplax sp. H2]
MSMERQFFIKDSHNKQITAIGYHPARRVYIIGFEDGLTKTMEVDTGQVISSTQLHSGWITDYFYWAESKLFFSSSNDGTIIAWGTAGSAHEIFGLGLPIYAMGFNSRKNLLVLGVKNGVFLFALKYELSKDANSLFENDTPLLLNIKAYFNIAFVSEENDDIVKCIRCNESRVYTGSYDRRLIIYDAYYYPGDVGLKIVTKVNAAHDAGITSLEIFSDNENNTWIVTGSFDKIVKVWSQDGKVILKHDAFTEAINDLCYVQRSKTIWIAAGSPKANLFDPKTGEDVSDFIGTFQNDDYEGENYIITSLMYVHEMNTVIASTNRRQIITWKYNPSGCVTALKFHSGLDSLTYTRKAPILMFTGTTKGEIAKWEQLQANNFTYTKEIYNYSEATSKLAIQLMEKQEEDCRKVYNVNRERFLSSISSIITTGDSNPSRQSFSPSILSSSSSESTALNRVRSSNNCAYIKSIFIESLDDLVIASEDSNIYVWGFDETAINLLNNIDPPKDAGLVERYSVLLDANSDLLKKHGSLQADQESVNNRVAGFICKFVLTGHTGCVTSLAVVERGSGYDTTYLISGGWDRKIYVWDLEAKKLHDILRGDDDYSNNNDELASDGIILDIEYCKERNEFAYASSDRLVYVRQFSSRGSEMRLVNVLQGHDGEVTQVRWCALHQLWITGSEDGTIRLWTADGISYDTVLNAHGSVAVLCIDQINGCILAGVQHAIRVYDPEYKTLVQTNYGHKDSVRDIIHIHERNQYISVSWDKTIRIWNAYKKPTRKWRNIDRDNEEARKNFNFNTVDPVEYQN